MRWTNTGGFFRLDPDGDIIWRARGDAAKGSPADLVDVLKALKE